MMIPYQIYIHLFEGIVVTFNIFQILHCTSNMVDKGFTYAQDNPLCLDAVKYRDLLRITVPWKMI